MAATHDVLASVTFSEGRGRSATRYTYTITRFTDPPRLVLGEDWGYDYNMIDFSDLQGLRRILEAHASTKGDEAKRAFADLVDQYIAAGGA